MSRVASLRTVNWLAETIRRHKAGEPVGVYSVCSAHPTVVQAAIAQAAADGSRVLIEATSNQVDQFGGYTGLRPAEFRDLVLRHRRASGFPRERVVLGGDHLGPNRWQRQSASAAMANAEVLIAAYVEAGYTKIHLDCSMACPDDPTVLADEIVAGRAARLLRVAEDTAHREGTDGPVYVIGTEVPVPGGAHETLGRLTPTPADRPGERSPRTGRPSPSWAWNTSGRASSPWWCSPASSSTTSTSSTTSAAPPPSCGACSTPKSTWSSRRTPPTTNGLRNCASWWKTTGPSSRSVPH